MEKDLNTLTSRASVADSLKRIDSWEEAIARIELDMMSELEAVATGLVDATMIGYVKTEQRGEFYDHFFEGYRVNSNRNGSSLSIEPIDQEDEHSFGEIALTGARGVDSEPICQINEFARFDFVDLATMIALIVVEFGGAHDLEQVDNLLWLMHAALSKAVAE